jgi:hypothetical protein
VGVIVGQMDRPANLALAWLGPGTIQPGSIWPDQLIELGWAARRADSVAQA